MMGLIVAFITALSWMCIVLSSLWLLISGMVWFHYNLTCEGRLAKVIGDAYGMKTKIFIKEPLIIFMISLAWIIAV